MPLKHKFALRVHKSANYMPMLRSDDEVQSDVLLRPNAIPGLEMGDVVWVSQPGVKNKHGRTPHVVLTVEGFQQAATRGGEGVSLVEPVVKVFELSQYKTVLVEKWEDLQSIAADLVVILVKDSFISRRDMWVITQKLIGKCCYLSKKLPFFPELHSGLQVSVDEIWKDGKEKTSGLVTENTRVCFRSASSTIHIFLQLSSEMWHFDSYGELYFEKAAGGFLAELFSKWKEFQCTHDVTIVFFSRTFYEAKSIDDFQESARDRISKDGQGRFYEDFYKVIIQNERYEDWTTVLVKVRKNYYEHRSATMRCLLSVTGEPIIARISTASQGNLLEVMNFSLNVYEKHFVDRIFDRLGKTVIIITPGPGVFEVDKKLMTVTKQRTIDSGCSADLICMGEQPMHAVPLFKVGPEAAASIPHWINHSFYMSEAQLHKNYHSPYVCRVKAAREIDMEPTFPELFNTRGDLYIAPLPVTMLDEDNMTEEDFDNFDAAAFAPYTTGEKYPKELLPPLEVDDKSELVDAWWEDVPTLDESEEPAPAQPHSVDINPSSLGSGPYEASGGGGVRSRPPLHVESSEEELEDESRGAVGGAPRSAVDGAVGGAGRDADRGLGRDADRGAGRDADRGAGRDADPGAGRDGNRGAGRDGDRGAGRDEDRGAGRDAGRGAGRDADRGAGRDPDRGAGRDAAGGPGRDAVGGPGHGAAGGAGRGAVGGAGRDGERGAERGAVGGAELGAVGGASGSVPIPPRRTATTSESSVLPDMLRNLNLEVDPLETTVEQATTSTVPVERFGGAEIILPASDATMAIMAHLRTFRSAEMMTHYVNLYCPPLSTSWGVGPNGDGPGSLSAPPGNLSMTMGLDFVGSGMGGSRKGQPINPFMASQIRFRYTSNRRRWAHAFPPDKNGKPIQPHHQLDEAALVPNNPPFVISDVHIKRFERLAGYRRERSLTVMNAQSRRAVERARAGGSSGGDGEDRKEDDKKEAGFREDWSPMDITGVDWRSLTRPALLPITTDYLPDDLTFEKKYAVVSRYNLEASEDSPSGAFGENNRNEEYLNELVVTRILMGYQLITKPKSSASEEDDDEPNSGRKKPADKSVTRETRHGLQAFCHPSSKQIDVSYHLSLGKCFHTLSLEKDGSISVTVQGPKSTVRARQESNKTTPPLEYTYRFMGPDALKFEVSKTSFEAQELSLFKWSHVDNYTLTGMLGLDRYRRVHEMKHWRSRFFMIPMDNSGTSLIQAGIKANTVTRALLAQRKVELSQKKGQALRDAKEAIKKLEEKHIICDVYTGSAKHAEFGENFVHVLSLMNAVKRECASVPTAKAPAAKAPLKSAGSTGSSGQPAAAPRKDLRWILSQITNPSLGFKFVVDIRFPKTSFISAEAAQWMSVKLPEVAPNAFEATVILDKLLQARLIRRVIQTTEQGQETLRYGFYLYFITGNGSPVTCPYTNVMEVEFVLPSGGPQRYLAPPLQRPKGDPKNYFPGHSDMMMDMMTHWPGVVGKVYKPYGTPTRSSWSCYDGEDGPGYEPESVYVLHHSQYHPECAYDLEIDWMSASVQPLCHILTSWNNKAKQHGYHLYPVPADPFYMENDDLSDPLRGPLPIPLHLACCTGFTSKAALHGVRETTILKQMILKRFGFVPIGDASKPSRERLYFVHTTGAAFIHIPLTPIRLDVHVPVTPVRRDAHALHTPAAPNLAVPGVKPTFPPPSYCKPASEDPAFMAALSAPSAFSAASVGLEAFGSVPGEQAAEGADLGKSRGKMMSPCPCEGERMMSPVSFGEGDKKSDLIGSTGVGEGRPKDTAGGSKKEGSKKEGSKKEGSKKEEEITPVHYEPFPDDFQGLRLEEGESPLCIESAGFHWSWNFMSNNCWRLVTKVDRSSFEQLQDAILLDFRSFCSNEDGRLEVFLSDLAGGRLPLFRTE